MNTALLARQHAVDSVYRDIQKIITAFSIHRLGRIKTVYQDGDYTTRATVEFLDFDEFGTKHMATGVEVLYPGSKKYGERYNVEVGDYVLLLGFTTAITSITDKTAPAKPTNAFPYSGATMKAIPIQPSTVSDDHIVNEVTEDGRAIHVKTPLKIDLPEDTPLDLAVGKTTIGVADDGALNLVVAEDKCSVGITADGAVSLAVGDSKCSVSITADGAVTIECADALTISSDGDIAVTGSSIDFNSGALSIS